MVAEGARKSPELIQLLELHTQFATITPYSQVRHQRMEKLAWDFKIYTVWTGVPSPLTHGPLVQILKQVLRREVFYR